MRRRCELPQRALRVIGRCDLACNGSRAVELEYSVMLLLMPAVCHPVVSSSCLCLSECELFLSLRVWQGVWSGVIAFAFVFVWLGV